MANEDYYALLGVGRGADDAEIKRAFRKLARQYHPDANPGNPEAAENFKRISLAYSVLSDPEKRARYDQLGHQAFEAAESGQAPGNGFAGGFGFGGTGFEDLFESVLGDAFFGGGRRRRAGPQRGADLQVQLQVTLEEAAAGVRGREFTIPRTEACEACGGTGAAKGAQRTTCPTCRGAGRVRMARTTPFGQFVTEQGCTTCGGTGSVVERPCPECRGQGRLRRRRTLTVDIPAGIDTGHRLRLANAGEAGEHGGPAGDLYIDIVVAPHPVFRREGQDIVSDVRIGIGVAALGGEVEVDTLDGKAMVRIPEGTQPGDVLRLKGRGLVAVHGRERGDQRVIVQVEVPRHLTPQEREHLRKYAEAHGEHVDSGERHPFRRVLGR